MLVLNAGSSSIKFQVLDTSTGEHRVKGVAQNLNKSKETRIITDKYFIIMKVDYVIRIPFHLFFIEGLKA